MEYKVVAKVSSGRHVVSRLVLVPVTSHGSNATAFIVWVCRHGGLFTHQPAVTLRRVHAHACGSWLPSVMKARGAGPPAGPRTNPAGTSGAQLWAAGGATHKATGAVAPGVHGNTTPGHAAVHQLTLQEGRLLRKVVHRLAQHGQLRPPLQHGWRPGPEASMEGGTTGAACLGTVGAAAAAAAAPAAAQPAWPAAMYAAAQPAPTNSTHQRVQQHCQAVVQRRLVLEQPGAQALDVDALRALCGHEGTVAVVGESGGKLWCRLLIAC